MKILIIRFSSLGDILLTTPVFPLLKLIWPKCQIDFVTKEAFNEILTNNALIDHTFLLKKRQSLKSLKRNIQDHCSSYDIIIDLHSKLRSSILRKYLNGKQVIHYSKPYVKRVLLIKLHINLYKDKKRITEQYFELIFKKSKIAKQWRQHNPSWMPKLQTYLATYDGSVAKLPLNGSVAIALGATWFTKKWPLHNYAILIQKISIAYPKRAIVLIGGQAEASEWQKSPYADLALPNMFNFMGKLNILQSNNLLKQSKVLITNDSGVMHMGASNPNTHIIALFLATSQELGFYPFSNNCTIIDKPLPCKPCDNKGLAKCPKSHFKCAELISIDEVFLEVKKQLD